MLSDSDAAKGFSLVLGGPIYQFLVRIGLVKPPLDRLGGRIAAITLFAWAPLAALTAWSGRLAGGVGVPFLHDFEVHARLLVALPLLIAAEVTVHDRIKMLLSQFVDRQIIGPRASPQFERCLQSAVRLRNSAAIEIGLLLLVIVFGHTSAGVVFLRSDAWYTQAIEGKRVLAPAGYWYEFVSVPLVQFIALRWYFRLLIWTRLMWQISRLDLTLVATHPDGRCGLGFLGTIASALGPFLVAHSVLLAGYVANRILYDGATLQDYSVEMVSVALWLYIVALGPISVFAPRVLRERLHGIQTYGALASEYVIGFEKKWIRGERPFGEHLVGSSDIQSLADLGNSFEVVQHINPLPFGLEAILGIALGAALPLLPLTLTMFSFRELVARLLQIVL